MGSISSTDVEKFSMQMQQLFYITMFYLYSFIAILR